MNGQDQLSQRAATLLPQLIEDINVPVYRVEEKGGCLVLYLYGHTKPVRKKLPAATTAKKAAKTEKTSA